MKLRDVDPAVRRLFPWALFLALALVFAFLAAAHADEPSKHFWQYTCDDIRVYLQTHSVAEARAEAVARHLPRWLIRKAEKCI
jgi:hypothetical protein